jgi:hypothetical protein
MDPDVPLHSLNVLEPGSPLEEYRVKSPHRQCQCPLKDTTSRLIRYAVGCVQLFFESTVIWWIAIWFVGSLIWLSITIPYSLDKYLVVDSPIHPYRHPVAHGLFVAFGIFTIIFPLCILYFKAERPERWVVWPFGITLSIILAVWGLVFLIVWGATRFASKPMHCPSQLPVSIYLKTNELDPFSSEAYIWKGLKVYKMQQKRVDEAYYATVSHETFEWRKVYAKPPRQINGTSLTTPYPPDTGIYSLQTLFVGNDTVDGYIKGTCINNTSCLYGSFSMSPRLQFEYLYTNPITGDERYTKIESDTGKWYFGQKHLPMVSLKTRRKVETFRVEDSRRLCTGGNGEIETSIVPLGLMFIADRANRGKQPEMAHFAHL